MVKTRTYSRTPSDYKESVGQNWHKTAHDGVWCIRDQFGFRIDMTDVKTLYWKDEFIIKTNSLVAAKEISTILLNDKILHG